MRVTYHELHDVLTRALVKAGLEPERARLSARLIADASRDGVPSHGLNLFPRLVTMIRSGVVDVQALPRCVSTHGAIARWDGGRGVGNLNAYEAMSAAIAMARRRDRLRRAGEHQSLDAGRHLRLAGGRRRRDRHLLDQHDAEPSAVGRRRAAHRQQSAGRRRATTGGHVVLDMAMSQFSYGALAAHRIRGEMLPVPGGFDSSGALTRDPVAIEASGRLLPIGFWKGSGLALMLDMMAALLSGGRAITSAGTPSRRRVSRRCSSRSTCRRSRRPAR